MTRIPLTVRFENVAADETVSAACVHELQRLERRSDGPHACEVVIARTSEARIDIRILAELRSGDVSVTHSTQAPGAHASLGRAVRAAFDALSSCLHDHARRPNALHPSYR